jgi:DNA (cytosine-5)-methyltransferase 1
MDVSMNNPLAIPLRESEAMPDRIEPRSELLRPFLSPSPCTLVVAGLFAGIGGFEEGFRQAGHVTNLFCESDIAAQRVLKERFPGVELVDDIIDLDSISQCDVITAGFPCQDLSQVGSTRGITGANSSLVKHVFRLLADADARIRWLVLENVPFMLRLHRGQAIREVTQALSRLGWNWAYRILDTRSFGLPQRRLRVFLVASRTEDPRPVLLCEDVDEKPCAISGRSACGFYWTEGHRGLGWATNAIPPLKGGSGVAIPSPPAMWFPARRAILVPSIEDAERLQGFPAGWTAAAAIEPEEDRRRWRLVGNAVSVPVAAWLGDRLRQQESYDPSRDEDLDLAEPWPDAAWGVDGRVAVSPVSAWPIAPPKVHLASFLKHRPKPLSTKAAAGFLARLEHSCLRRDDAFVADLRRHIATTRKRAKKMKTVDRNKTVDRSVSRRMAATPGRDNPAELALRSALYREGYRFRIHRKVLPGLRRTADIAFPSLKVAIFLDGCFWHGCPIHGTWPKKNAKWWREKIRENQCRDRDTDSRLKDAGWTVVRAWEHEDMEVVVKRITHMLRARKARTIARGGNRKGES